MSNAAKGGHSGSFHRLGGGYGMARILVQYIADPHRVRSEILSNLEFAPDLDTIVALRADWLRRGRSRSTKGTEGPLLGDDPRQEMEDASHALLRRLYQSHPYVFDTAERHGRKVVRP